ncbi:MAG: hypothetical protein JW925_09450 [Syntrophaceae bacterium]|nr:hypothetical protein [Syntrophaceae bacterium]
MTKSSLTISAPLFSGLSAFGGLSIPLLRFIPSPGRNPKGAGLPAFDHARGVIMHHSGKKQNKYIIWSETRILNQYRQTSPIHARRFPEQSSGSSTRILSTLSGGRAACLISRVLDRPMRSQLGVRLMPAGTEIIC